MILGRAILHHAGPCTIAAAVMTAFVRMRRRPQRALRALIAAAALAGACAPTPVASFAATPQGQYRLDPNHASVIWRIGHLNGLSRVVGRFDEFDAALDFNADAPEQSRLTATITATSINTGLGDFDGQLAANARILDAERHPQLRFVSTAVTLIGDNRARVSGDLTLRGVTAPVTLDVTFNGTTRDPLRRGARVVGFSAATTVQRSDFGADAYTNFGVSDAVEVLIEAEFIRNAG